MSGFRKFILRGNVIDLAVGIIIGAAFTAIVTALVKDLITPLIGSLVQLPDFSSFNTTVNGSKLAVGDFVNAVISFLLIAFVVYFCIVLPMNALLDRIKAHERPADQTNKKCTECLSDIPIAAKRCAFCTEPQK